MELKIKLLKTEIYQLELLLQDSNGERRDRLQEEIENLRFELAIIEERHNHKLQCI